MMEYTMGGSGDIMKSEQKDFAVCQLKVLRLW